MARTAFSQHTTPIEVRMQWSQGAGHIRALHEIKHDSSGDDCVHHGRC